MKKEIKLTVNIGWKASEYSDTPDTVKLTFTPEDIARIFKVAQLKKEHDLESVKINWYAYDWNEEYDWRAECTSLIIFGSTVYFYAQNKYDPSDQLESDEIVLTEICKALEMTIPTPPLKHLLFGEEAVRVLNNDGIDALVSEIEYDVTTGYELYEYDGNYFELLNNALGWADFAWISEEDYNRLSIL